VRVGDSKDRRSSTRGEGAPDHGFEHEARLVHEDDMSVPLLGILKNARELFPHPPLDLIIIAIGVLARGTLASPVQMPLQ
jgi:hypothetical protein